ncbi:MAG TPA: ABC transporter permease [Actinomycetota bacterium]|nr:ABC transporter permease [Actinomycetota bacterium]
MGRYVVRRLLYLILVILIITMLMFFIFYVMPPTDPALAFAGKLPTPEIVAEVRHNFGLDKPLAVQYGLFVKRLFMGDEYGWPGLGFSYVYRAPVRDLIFERFPATLQLVIGGAVVWVLIGLPIGIVSALKRRSFFDRAAMMFALFGVSAPIFFVGLVALYFFWYKWGISPGTGYEPMSNLREWASYLWLPWIVLALQFAAFYARMVRGNLLETMGEDYIRTARAKGLPERKVVGKHGLRASLTPIVTMFGMDFAILLTGTIITESVFNINGIGALIAEAANRGDLPLVLAITVLAAFVVTLMSLIVDVLYAYLDPRVRYA